MERIVQKKVSIPDGTHKGKISRVEERSEPYKYIDVYIEMESPKDFEIKYGCPDYLSETSKLGKLLKKFTEIKEDNKIDIEKILVGKQVSFMTLTESTEKGEFARIVDGSIKPLIAEQGQGGEQKQ